MEREMLEK